MYMREITRTYVFIYVCVYMCDLTNMEIYVCVWIHIHTYI